MEEKKEILNETPELETAVSPETAVETPVEEKESLSDRVRVLSPGMMVAKRFFRSKLSVIGLLILVALFIFSFIGPMFSQWSNAGVSVKDEGYKTVTIGEGKISYIQDGEAYTAYAITETLNDFNKRGDMTWDHLLGTDDSGYDLFTNLMLGGRISLTIGFVVVIMEAILGAILGGVAGYFGGWIDNLIMRIVDVLSCIPSMPIMLILSIVLTNLGITDISKLYYMMIVLTLLGWTGIARLVRGQILSLREQDFMLAAKASGISTSKKIFRHLLPNVMPQLIVSMTMGLGSIILMEATLGFLGLGAPMDVPTWGSMISAASKYTYLNYYPNFWIPPGICITLAILGFNFVGDGLRDAFDPKMKR